VLKRLKISLFLLVATVFAACNATIVETDCLKVVAAEVVKDGWLVQISAISIEVKDGCNNVKAARYKSYREKNGKPGYQLDPHPSDELVDQKEAEVDEETSTLNISNVSNSNPNTGRADSWQLDIDHEGGGSSTFSGNF